MVENEEVVGAQMLQWTREEWGRWLSIYFGPTELSRQPFVGTKPRRHTKNTITGHSLGPGLLAIASQLVNKIMWDINDSAMLVWPQRRACC